ncbi:Udp-glycosyltransferase 87a2 [Thalictrum thalictroides]|uniref:peptidyl-tRNA hydrolase n=1 Tax=Thalictrum thalictroides TaxID=46969 RepID=A0A7J6W3B5_THATH|nr:Udp-glycosyltransferase 87a2 [Thalictrum thalictroides]
MSSSSSCETPCCHVVAIPYPGRGHINPMMNLCKLLVTKCANLKITFIITEEWLGFIGSTPKPPTITFQTIPNVIPSELIHASVYREFVRAVFTKMEAPVEHLLCQLQLSHVLAIISDTFLPWAVTLGNRMNIPVVSLWTMSPSLYSVFFPFRPAQNRTQGDGLHSWCLSNNLSRPAILPTLISGLGKQALDEVLEAFCCIRQAQCVMFTSFYELERQVIDSLKTTVSFPLYSVGPLIPHMKHDPIPDANMEYLKLLDSQPAKSVLYISFGSFLSVSREQMDEIVEGVRESGVTYLWVGRGDTLEYKKLVVFMLEFPCLRSLPIAGDQIPDSKLIVDDWKVGMKVGDATEEKLVRVLQNHHRSKHMNVSTEASSSLPSDLNNGIELKQKDEEVVVQYVVLRRDLIDSWPLGSVVTQGCHASVSAIWTYKDDNSTIDYCSPEKIDSMHKVTLEVKGETQLLNLSQKLTASDIAHKLWIEQPENMPTCLATKPYPKSVISSFFKKLKLCK